MSKFITDADLRNFGKLKARLIEEDKKKKQRKKRATKK